MIDKAASIGIIGGADGPTAIFVTGGTDLLPAVLLGAALLIWILLVIRGKKNRK